MRLITLLTSLSLLFVPSFAHGQSLIRSGSGNVVQKMENGQFDWTTMELCAYGYADPNQSIPAQIIAAQNEAYRNLLATVDKVTIDSTTIVRTAITEGRITKDVVKGVLHNPRLSEPQEETIGGRILIKVLACKTIGGDLAKRLLPPLSSEAKPMAPAPVLQPDMPVTPVTERTYTGLIIDATGKGVWPGLLPKILAQGSSRVIYGPGVFDPKAVIDGCAADYAWAVEEARKRPRVGKNPLIIQALSTSGETYKVDLVISPDDAVKIYRADLRSHFLKNAKVVIVCGS